MEEDVAATSCSKKMLHLFRWLRLLIVEGVTTHQISSLFIPTLLCIFLDQFQWES